MNRQAIATLVSRIAAFAGALAIVGTASIAFTATSAQAEGAVPAASIAAARPVRTVVLDTVVVTARRLPVASAGSVR